MELYTLDQGMSLDAVVLKHTQAKAHLLGTKRGNQC